MGKQQSSNYNTPNILTRKDFSGERIKISTNTNTPGERALSAWFDIIDPMSPKRAVMLGLIIGSIVGGYIPSLWGTSLFSFSSIIFGAIGSLIGIYLGYKLTA